MVLKYEANYLQTNNNNRKSNYFTITFAVRITLLLSFTTTT